MEPSLSQEQTEGLVGLFCVPTQDRTCCPHAAGSELSPGQEVVRDRVLNVNLAPPGPWVLPQHLSRGLLLGGWGTVMPPTRST